MAPKLDKGQQKAIEKQKAKIVEDKTFGLKNKNKSKAVQKYIKGVQQQVQGPQKGGDAAQFLKDQQAREEKKRTQQQQALLASLFKGTENIKKISEDAKIQNPQTIKEDQKINLYTDMREQTVISQASATCAGWSQQKLERVIAAKHEKQKQIASTNIICKFFLDALEKNQYGWFWVCPNDGDNCKYKHCLPPGYVLKTSAPVEDDDEEEDIPLEEIIEAERAALPSGGTPVTLETLKIWKLKKEKERQQRLEDERQEMFKKKGGRAQVLTGRDLFIYDPTLFIDDDEAAADDDYEEDAEYWTNLQKEEEEAAAASCARGEDDMSSVDEEIPEGTNKTTDAGPSLMSAGAAKLFLEANVPDELDDLEF